MITTTDPDLPEGNPEQARAELLTHLPEGTTITTTRRTNGELIVTLHLPDGDTEKWLHRRSDHTPADEGLAYRSIPSGRVPTACGSGARSKWGCGQVGQIARLYRMRNGLVLCLGCVNARRDHEHRLAVAREERRRQRKQKTPA